MAFVPLVGGAYEPRSTLASVQHCINLMPENILHSDISGAGGQGEAIRTVHYPTPGLVLQGILATGGAWRGMYRANNGNVYGAIGATLLMFTAGYVVTLLGTLATSSGPVSLADNSVTLLVVDGTAAGYTVDLTSNAFALISDPAFYGGDKVSVLDGYFVLNRPGTNQFYLSDNIATTWNPLYIAAKSSLDKLVSLTAMRSELWLMGKRTTEIYQDTGAADFPFARVSGGIEHGCAAAQSVAKADSAVLWLSTDTQGRGVVVQGANYVVTRVSTHAIESIIQTYTRLDDAVGWVYQLGGHTVYVLNFPTANACWCYDLATTMWHRWQWTDGSRFRGQCYAEAFGANLVGDCLTGALYTLDFANTTYAGAAIPRLRTFAHMVNDGNRVFYSSFTADMQCGTVPAGQPEPQLQLRFSDDRGATWSNPIFAGMGLNGATLTSLQFQRLGYARDRVFEVSWSAAVQTALQGAYITTVQGRT